MSEGSTRWRCGGDKTEGDGGQGQEGMVRKFRVVDPLLVTEEMYYLSIDVHSLRSTKSGFRKHRLRTDSLRYVLSNVSVLEHGCGIIWPMALKGNK